MNQGSDTVANYVDGTDYVYINTKVHKYADINAYDWSMVTLWKQLSWA